MDFLPQELFVPPHIEYLIVDRQLRVRSLSAGASQFSEESAPMGMGEEIGICIPELIGSEDLLQGVLEGQASPIYLQNIVRVRQGERRYFDLHTVAYDRHYLVIFLEDVSDRGRLEQTLVQATNELNLLLARLRDAKDYIDNIVSSIAEALLVTTTSGTITSTNRAAQTLFGYTEAELLQRSIYSLVAKSEQALIQDRLEEASRHPVEIACCTKTGAKRVISFSRSVVQTDRRRDFAYIGRDITDERRSQQRQTIQYAINRILSEVTTLPEAILQVLRTLCTQSTRETLGWDVGEWWMKVTIQGDEETAEQQQLRCIETWSREHVAVPLWRQNTKRLVLDCGEGLAGRVWAEDRPIWIADLVRDGGFVSREYIEQAALHSALAFPVRVDEEVLGVMSLFSLEVQQCDLEMQDLAAAIGNQLGQFVKRKRAERALRLQQKRSEQLLHNILPQTIADRLKRSPQTIAEHFQEVTVLFADIVGFTQIAAQLQPLALVQLLNQIFSAFDRLVDKHRLEKIKTIGDAYMVVGGLPRAQPDAARIVANMALDMQTAIAEFNREYQENFSIRIGIHTGSVVAGVIGLTKFSYDLWGDTVNIASRMESYGMAGKIQVSEVTQQFLKEDFDLEERSHIEIKGKGTMKTYWLLGRKGEKGETL